MSDNELIAKFMGYTLLRGSETKPAIFTGKNTYSGLEYCQYDTSWDWLMPVVIKCHEIGDAKEKEFDAIDSDLDDPKGWRSWSYRRVDLSTDIQQVYKNVVLFIKWYNSQPHD